MSQQKQKFARILPLMKGMLIATGIVIMGCSAAMEWLEVGSEGVGPAQVVMVVIGSLYAITGFLIGPLGDRGVGLATAMLMGFGVLAVAEVSGHILDYDFDHTHTAWNSTPVYYRQPIEPIGDAFFRRPGPTQWTGKVLSTQLQRVNAAETDAYADERSLTFHYDALGFRNPAELRDWDVVFVGDSFTELGYLPHSELVSTRVGANLGVRVKNLGVSYTGTLTHNFYLRNYGRSGNTRKAILVFFEGNDIKDAVLEHKRLEEFRKTGFRETRDLESQRQTSFLVASAKTMQRVISAQRGPITNENAVFESADGDQAVSLLYSLPNASELDSVARQVLEAALSDWAKTADEMELEPWLVYMPVKHRVIYDHIRYLPNADPDIAAWQPSDLPQHVAELCRDRGIRFIDATPVLSDAAAAGHLPYNAIWDTHLNSLGTQVVAKLVADRLSGSVETVLSNESNRSGQGLDASDSNGG